MPKRFANRYQRDRRYDELLAKYGVNACNYCGKRAGTKRQLEIDHIDSNPANDALENQQLLCRGCNQAKENLRRCSLPHDKAAVLAARHYHENRGGSALPTAPSTYIYKSADETAIPPQQESALEREENYRKAPEQIQRRDRYIPLFETFVNVNLAQAGKWHRTDFVLSCSVFTGASPKWVDGEVKRQLSTLGTLSQQQDASGEWWLTLRKQGDRAPRNGHHANGSNGNGARKDMA